MAQDRFIVSLSPGVTAEDTATRTMQELVGLVRQINQAKMPIVVGPNETLPEGMLPGQPVIDWRSGVTLVKTWNGLALI